MLPSSAIVYLTNKCFLKCNHCFIKDCGRLNSSELEYETLINTLEDFKKNKVFIVAYTGGDPLLYPKILDVLKETYKRKMLPLLGISGIGVTEDLARKIHDTGVSCVQVSLDGSNEELNSKFRGKNVFSQVVESIRNLQKSQINVNIAICISNENFNDYKNLINLCKELNAYKIKIEFWHDYTNKGNFTMLTKEQKEEVAMFCNEFEKNHNLKDYIYCPTEASALTDIHNNSLVIDADGLIRNFENGPVIGNIYTNVPSHFFVTD